MSDDTVQSYRESSDGTARFAYVSCGVCLNTRQVVLIYNTDRYLIIISVLNGRLLFQARSFLFIAISKISWTSFADIVEKSFQAMMNLE